MKGEIIMAETATTLQKVQAFCPIPTIAGETTRSLAQGKSLKNSFDEALSIYQQAAKATSGTIKTNIKKACTGSYGILLNPLMCKLVN